MSDQPTSASFGINTRTAPSIDGAIASGETPELSFVEAVELRAAQMRNQVPIQKEENAKRFLRWIAYLVAAIVLAAGGAVFLGILKS